MMLDILRKLNFYSILFISILLLGCKNDFKNEIIFHTSTNKLTYFSSFYLYEEKNLLLFIDDNIKNKIKDEEIKKIEIITNSENYVALPIKQFFSREKPSSNFSFFIHNKTNKIVLDSIDNKEYIMILPEKTSLKDILKSENLKLLNTDSK